ncbi:TonB-dependent receptor domain-containing protein [Rhodothalassium salexigens]|uniref:TonB-dependent receptor domain-containing protein n=1 Tax=Rhodothalassium salexigens TaxID=1086 RepID=UPI001914154F
MKRFGYMSRRAGLLGTSAAAVMTLAAPTALAQQSPDQPAQAGAGLEIEEIVVTGSRIQRSNLTAPTPVTVIDAEQISLQGEVNIANYLNQLPALGSTFTSASSTGFIGTTGLASLDLRRMGTDRTLVLVDGRRHVATSAGSSAVDINSIPQELVERVEVVTGGASAVYGADAVTGVVNFILKDDFDGFTVFGQAGQADEGDAFTYTTRFTAGSNFANGRGNAVFSGEWSSTNGIDATDRSFERRNLRFVPNPENGDTPDNPVDGIPDEILIENARLGFITLPGVFSTPAGTFEFDENGNLDPFDFGSQQFADGSQIGGDGVPLSVIGGTINGDVERAIFNGKMNYELHRLANFFAEMKYVNTQAYSESGTAAFDIGSLNINVADYAFLKDDVRQQLLDQGAETITMSRSHRDLGRRGSDAERQLFRAVIGFNGEFDNGWTYELSGVWGRSTSSIQQTNNRINDRFFAGLDAVIDPATGNPVCRASIDPEAAAGLPDFAVNGCVPINILGPNAISEEAADWATADGFLTEKVEQVVTSLVFTGDSSPYFELPAGPIAWAAGMEYRDEYAESYPTEIDQLGASFLNEIFPTTGGFDVWEGFAEVSVPLVSNKPFIRDLSVDSAFRYGNYSTVGGTVAWKVGANYSPSEDVRFRGTYAKAVRAPNISELFSPQNQTFQFYDDPCDVDFIDEGSANRAANCQALGLPADFQQDNTRGNTPGTSGGNPNVAEETATTFTIGAVFTPRFLPDMSLSVDFWDIEIDDAIDTPGLQDVLENCVDAPSIDNTFCGLIQRETDPTNPEFNQVVGFTLTNQNIASQEARGIDIEFNYNLDTASLFDADYGTVNFRVIGTHVLHRREFPFQIAPDEFNSEAGELGDPEWALTYNMTYRLDRLSFNYELRYISDMLLVQSENLANDPDLQEFVSTGKTFYHDIQARYQLTDYLEVFAGINNLTQEFPPFGLSGAGTDSAIFDNIGRFYYGGARVSF